ncbi:MAG TPA: hypothetical protein DC058_17595 [Planctomycetaceae bacterium]|nr:hypothetical protein [Planctomycetaceae bacterium]HBC63013.1 hypothetical protein [Planctomycetaceae bacterium]
MLRKQQVKGKADSNSRLSASGRLRANTASGVRYTTEATTGVRSASIPGEFFRLQNPALTIAVVQRRQIRLIH